MHNLPGKGAGVLATLLLVASAAAPARAQEGAAGTSRTETLIPGGSSVAEVRLQHADSMAVTRDPSQPQVFQGNVDVVVVDRDQREARLQATKISIYYLPDTRQVDRLIAEGNVIVTRDSLRATTELAVYDGKASTVDLLEDNYIKDARGELTADRIRVFLQTNQVSATGNVRGVVYPQRIDMETDAEQRGE